MKLDLYMKLTVEAPDDLPVDAFVRYMTEDIKDDLGAEIGETESFIPADFMDDVPPELEGKEWDVKLLAARAWAENPETGEEVQ